MKKQRGLSFVGFVLVAILVSAALLLCFKVVPAYVEYFNVSKALDNIVRQDAGQSPQAIRESFMKHADISEIHAVTAQDLVINQNGGVTTIAANYEKVIPLIANISLLISFDVEKTSK